MEARYPLAAAVDPHRSGHSIFRRRLAAARRVHGSFVCQDHHVAIDLHRFEVAERVVLHVAVGDTLNHVGFRRQSGAINLQRVCSEISFKRLRIFFLERLPQRFLFRYERRLHGSPGHRFRFGLRRILVGVRSLSKTRACECS